MDVLLYYTAVVMHAERLLGGFETLLLLAVIRLDGLAYGVSVRSELKEQAGKDVAVGAIYTGLDRLNRKVLWNPGPGIPLPNEGVAPSGSIERLQAVYAPSMTPRPRFGSCRAD